MLFSIFMASRIIRVSPALTEAPGCTRTSRMLPGMGAETVTAPAAPAGAVIWCFTNCHIGGGSIFAHCAALLDTPAQFIGLDGVILLGFLLGFPANEIVLPIICMGYTAGNALAEITT